MTADKLLFPLFDHLRRHGVPLGVSEYLLVVKTLRQGRGLEDINRLKRFCRLVWTKSRDDQEIFDEAFADCILPRLHPPKRAEQKLRDKDRRKEQLHPSPSEGEESRVETVTTSVKQAMQEQAAFRVTPLSRTAKVRPYQMEERRTFHLIPRLPLGKREMAGAWRHLRRLQRSGPAEELDVERTIQAICRTGCLFEPVMQPRRRNQAQLVVFTDQQGSMAPFTSLVETLVESIIRGGMLGRVSRYYFHDVPEEVLYERRNLTGALPVEAVLSAHAKHNSVLIVSDAGAARRNFEKQRLEHTRTFLHLLNAHTYLYAWLNPMPVQRWKGTTAEDIASLVPMFPLDRSGLNDTINILRGHPFPPGVKVA